MNASRVSKATLYLFLGAALFCAGIACSKKEKEEQPEVTVQAVKAGEEQDWAGDSHRGDVVPEESGRDHAQNYLHR